MVTVRLAAARFPTGTRLTVEQEEDLRVTLSNRNLRQKLICFISNQVTLAVLVLVDILEFLLAVLERVLRLELRLEEIK